ncbi:hypothetical protein ADU80_00645 (plasmid) [Clostridium botulinum]|uniref:Uncharacterized protein n=1 Tax=Clostridium botulinum TaxID=1491 RepID=A0A9Q1UVX9_CLOBO|nr:hypothetical protein [Clostridium botulinum]AEB77290.1 hypothetical protein CbC4_4090 [Clostridium botulinum BKT015925]KEH96286.1 hypothetical protein Y848_13450 [Clostridium botulinum C/D str. Sp77]KEH96494.1 hypothetical protein Z953_p0070 [Clostridium botulinum D str. 16868]KLU74387.1 hypothetical protein CBC3_p0089 [Clostridium botulinum V891]KOA75723.1 hypothetical protein ADU78_07305 [Clostridium botulinum]
MKYIYNPLVDTFNNMYKTYKPLIDLAEHNKAITKLINIPISKNKLQRYDILLRQIKPLKDRYTCYHYTPLNVKIININLNKIDLNCLQNCVSKCKFRHLQGYNNKLNKNKATVNIKHITYIDEHSINKILHQVVNKLDSEEERKLFLWVISLIEDSIKENQSKTT